MFGKVNGAARKHAREWTGRSPQQIARALLVVLADDGASLAPGLDVTVERPGLDALATARVAGQPLSSLARVTYEVEPAAIAHVDGLRTVDLEWEAGGDWGLLRRVKKALDGLPSAVAELVD